MQRRAHGDAFNDRLAQGAPCTADGLVAGSAGDDDLGEHGVEHGGHDVAFDDAGLDADTGSGGPAQAGDGTRGGRQTTSRVLAGDAQLDGVTAGLGDRPQMAAGGYAQL